MGFFDYVSDLYSSISIQSCEAEVQDDLKYSSGDFNSGKDQQNGMGTAEQRGGAATRGGVSTNSPASGTDEESDAEAEVNKADAKGSQGSSEKGHVAGSGGEGSGQVGADNAGPHGGSVGKDDDDEAEEEEGGDDEEEEEEEEEDEPEDIKPKLEEECAESKECAPYKHHYEHCVERVTKQQEENGKADEDCVEEFFHLAHCATACAAPKLFKALR